MRSRAITKWGVIWIALLAASLMLAIATVAFIFWSVWRYQLHLFDVPELYFDEPDLNLQWAIPFSPSWRFQFDPQGFWFLTTDRFYYIGYLRLFVFAISVAMISLGRAIQIRSARATQGAFVQDHLLHDGRRFTRRFKLARAQYFVLMLLLILAALCAGMSALGTGGNVFVAKPGAWILTDLWRYWFLRNIGNTWFGADQDGLWSAWPYAPSACTLCYLPWWRVFVAVLILFVLARRSWRRMRELRPMVFRYCGKCKYDLTGNTSGICPECGTKIPLGTPVPN